MNNDGQNIADPRFLPGKSLDVVLEQLELLADHVKRNGPLIDLEFVQIHATMAAELATWGLGR